MAWISFRRLRLGAWVAAAVFIGLPVSLRAGNLSEDGGTGVFRLQSAELPDETTLGFGFYNRLLNTDNKYFSSLLRDKVVTMADSAQGREPAHFWALSHVLAAGVSTHRIFEAHLAIPLYTEFLNWELGHIDAIALGDVRYGIKLALPMREDFPLAFALLLGGTLPTGQLGLPVPMRLEYVPESAVEQQSKSHAVGTLRYDWDVGGAATLDLEQTSLAWPTLLHFNTGARKTRAFEKNDADFYDIFSAGLGFEEHLSPTLLLEGEYWHENRVQLQNGNPMLDDISLGVTLNAANGFSFLMGGAVGLDNGYTAYAFYDQHDQHVFDIGVRSSPQAQIILAVTYTLGLKPKVVDTDGDGVPDDVDKCPTVPQGPNGKDGCPNPDSDGDGICDPWVLDNGLSPQFAGVCRGSDDCPDLRGDLGGRETLNGCPDPDHDKDGVCDPWVHAKGLDADYVAQCSGVDKCPNVPQGPNSVDGCPDPTPPPVPAAPVPAAPAPPPLPIEQKTLILKGVTFETANAVLLASSYPALDELASELQTLPNIELEISGHTDDRGSPAVNLKLSRARAQAVANYLVRKGVAANRLKVAGYGSGKPVATNHTAEGRAQNRRVEFNRLK